jgi:hypothetical protein
MNQNKTSIDPLFNKPHDHISGIIDGNRPSASEMLRRTEGKVNMPSDRVNTLSRLTSRAEKKGNTVSRKGLAVAMAVTALAGAWAVGRNAPDSEPPHPGNMEQFSNDPLQDAYAEDPDAFEIVGGEIKPKAIVLKTEPNHEAITSPPLGTPTTVSPEVGSVEAFQQSQQILDPTNPDAVARQQAEAAANELMGP